jgi:3-methyladenine DNA glycosylase AlkC
VWCAHIDALKRDPSRALPLLQPLRADEHKYVQDSVSNWLNDAAKTRADWVLQLTEGWLAGAPTRATQRIVTRARRSIHA